jgi:hypothetical protein
MAPSVDQAPSRTVDHQGEAQVGMELAVREAIGQTLQRAAQQFVGRD